MKITLLAVWARLTLVQVTIWIVVAIGTATFAPQLLLLDDAVVSGSKATALATLAFLCAFSAVLTAFLVRRVRSSLLAVATGVGEVEPEDVYVLYRIPLRLAASGLAAACLVTTIGILPGVRPETNDLITQASLALLVWTTASAGCLAGYVFMRNFVGRVLEQFPSASVREAAALHDLRRTRIGHVRNRIMLSAVVAVSFVALSAALLVIAHARALETSARETMARDLVQGVAAPVQGDRAGVSRAMEEARGLGFEVTLRPGTFEANRLTRTSEGETRMSILGEDGSGLVSFDTVRPTAVFGIYGALFAVAFLLAWLLGSWIGWFYERDLDLATKEIHRMGDLERSLRPSDPPDGSQSKRSPRFGAVQDLLAAIDGLGDVFRRFAEVHRRSIHAKETTERMRALFLASMSHDLKGPLNAILGFAELVRKGPLTSAQRESVDIILQRGRELLHLIQTVLDAARIEAGELQLSPTRARIDEIVSDATRESRDLLMGSEIAVDAHVQDDLLPVFVDRTRMVQAILAVVMSAARFTRPGAAVSIRAFLPEDARQVRVDIESPAGAIPQNEIEKIFVAFRYPEEARKFGSLGLGLSLARTIVEIHGGTIDIESSSSGVVFHVVFGAREDAESIRVRSRRSTHP